MNVSVRSWPLVNIMSGMLVDLPSPSLLSYMWNWGSLLGIFLGVQIVSGVFLAMHFSGGVVVSFDSVVHLMRDVPGGWLVRVVHSNGATLFFVFLYSHLGRGLYYGSYKMKHVWMVGVTIFLLSMIAAFLGYVLPWGQMSFWAATVITNLLSVVPYLGKLLVEWLWGGFSVGNATLTRFFAFHYLLPFVLLILVVLHLVFLHSQGSGNPLGVGVDEDSVSFYPYYVISDLLGLVFAIGVLVLLCFEFPFYFMDVENFIPANSLATPVHIQPEWYFLFAYAILRSVTSSVGGVVALVGSVMVFYLFPYIMDHSVRVVRFYFVSRVLFWGMVMNWGMLTWIGACVVDFPYSLLGKVFSVIYFLGVFFYWAGFSVQDVMMD